MNLEISTSVPPAKRSRKVAIAATEAPAVDPLESIVTTERKLTVAEFHAFPPHPRQRDTERHLAEAIKKHLSKPSPTHKRVAIAIFDGTTYKVDAHTRDLAWERGLLPKPEYLRADVFHCETFDQLLTLYGHFDNKAAVETVPDMLSGGLRQYGVELNSPALKAAKFASAMQAASRAFGDGETTDVYQNVAEFAPELQLLDTIDPQTNVFRVGVIGGALLCLRKFGAAALPFFEAYNENEGVKSATECDAVQALRDLISRPSSKGRMGFARTLELTQRAYSCCANYLKGETYAVSQNGVSVRATKLHGLLKGKRRLPISQ